MRDQNSQPRDQNYQTNNAAFNGKHYGDKQNGGSSLPLTTDR